MEKSLIVGGNVEGNIGSCAVRSETYSVSFWTVETVAVNSCTGEMVAQNQYFDGTTLLLIIAILGFGLGSFIAGLVSFFIE